MSTSGWPGSDRASTTPTDRLHLRELARQAGLPFVSLGEPGSGDWTEEVNPLATAMLSEQACRRFGAVPISYTGGVVTVATSDPSDNLAREATEALLGRAVRWVVAAPGEIAAAIEAAFGPVDDVRTRSAAVGSAAPPPIANPPRGPVELVRAGRPANVPGPDGVLIVRLGDVLLVRGLVSREQIDLAVAEQQRTGGRIGEILTHNRDIAESDLIAALAEQLRLPLVDVSGLDPSSLPFDLIPEPLARHLRCVPIGVDEHTLYLAVSDALDDDAVAALSEHTNLELRGCLATRNSIDQLLQRIYADDYVSTATSELLVRLPEECAYRVVSAGQRVSFVLLAVLVLALAVSFPIPTLIALVGLSSVFYAAASLYKVKLMYSALRHGYSIQVTPEDLAALDERTLPRYSILVPLFHEAAILDRLIEGIEGLDYPKTLLDVRLLCEEEDQETVAAIRALSLPPHFKLVVVPASVPQTKPKACNYGLLHADGEIVVIYDAEDRPDPQQLKKVVVAFRRTDPRVACIQAKLSYFNPDQNLLTRWFAIEYAMWYELILPGLDADDVPIPLGGTSNHFIKDRLVLLGAWDPFNVTEDADLGIRLHKAGYQTAIIDSTTLEEANSVLANWVRQRSRWIKGYIQTWLVQMRHPVRLLRQLGPKSFISFQLLVGGTFIFLLNPVFWLLTTIFFLTHWGVIQEVFPSFVFYLAALQLFIGNFAFMYLNVAGAVERGYYGLAKYALFSPLYWGLMSVAAWKGFVQLFTNPFYWEKTVHGLDDTGESG